MVLNGVTMSSSTSTRGFENAYAIIILKPSHDLTFSLARVHLSLWRPREHPYRSQNSGQIGVFWDLPTGDCLPCLITFHLKIGSWMCLVFENGWAKHISLLPLIIAGRHFALPYGINWWRSFQISGSHTFGVSGSGRPELELIVLGVLATWAGFAQ